MTGSSGGGASVKKEVGKVRMIVGQERKVGGVSVKYSGVRDFCSVCNWWRVMVG